MFTLGVTQGGQRGPECYQDLSCRLCLFDIGAPSEKSKAIALPGSNILNYETHLSNKPGTILTLLVLSVCVCAV